jgi:lysophospholipase L1-like esterase
MRVALLGIGLAAPLLLVELILRALGPVFPGEYQLGVSMVPHPEYGRFHARESSVWLRTSEFVTYFRTNQFGHRGPAVSLNKPAEVGRILALGDSFIEARQVRESETTTSVLADLLGGARGSCQVLNAGIAGWGTGEELVYLRREGLALQPDLVIVYFYVGNDLGNNVRRPSGQAPHHRGPPFRLDRDGRLIQLEFERVEPPPPHLLALRQHSRAFSFFETGVLTKRGKAADDDGDDFRPEAGKLDLYAVNESWGRRQAWRVTEALLSAIRDESRAARAEMALVAIPAAYQVDPKEWAKLAARGRNAEPWDPDVPNRQLAQVAERLGVPYLDLLPVFRSAGVDAEAPFFWKKNAHWTPRGHRLAAEHVAALLSAHPRTLPAGCRL